MESDLNCSTPKLSLSKFPITNKFQKDHNNIVMVTPPIRTLAASVPFQWEESPGKPRNTSSLTKTVRCLELDLPPSRLCIDSDNVASPSTVLDGPYIGRTMSSRTMFSSFNDGCRSDKKKRLSLGSSWRWGSFKEVIVGNKCQACECVSSFPTSGGGLMRNGSKVKNITRMRRRSSFFRNFSRTSSNLVGGIYESFKQVVRLGHGQGKSTAGASTSNITHD